AIHAIFRGFHTIKGMAGFLDQDAVRDVAHEVETVLDLARNGQLAITSTIIDRILESKDYLSRCMADLESVVQKGSSSAPPDNKALLAAIRKISEKKPEADAAEAPSAPAGTEVTTEVEAVPSMEELRPTGHPNTESLMELAREISPAPPEPHLESSASA